MSQKEFFSGICRSFVVIPFVLLGLLASCSKDEVTDTAKEQQWAGEIYYNMKYIYLWNGALPASFEEKKYAKAEDAFEYLKGLKINPETGTAIDRYSFLDAIGNLSGELGTGVATGDLGFMVRADYNSSKEVSFFVTYVYKNSPAGLAGVRRGDEITQINGSNAVHPTVGTDGYLVTTSAGYVNMSNALLGGNPASFIFQHTNGGVVTTTLKPTSYTINSVLMDSVYSSGTDKVGYMVFNQFLDSTARVEISNSIGKFESKNVKYLIVDLRYNTGGSVATCEKFGNLVAPASANGKLMYTYKFNDYVAGEFAKENENMNTNFKKTNSFEPMRVYFIVGDYTASASELLINNLRPYFSGSIYLIGSTTYGKPCGFWATPIGYDEKQTSPKEGYDMYAVSFETVNANSEGGYYAGMTPGTSRYPGVLANDNIHLNWGDTSDPGLSQALYHIANGSFSSSASQVRSMSPSFKSRGIDKRFNGMIDFRRHLPAPAMEK